MQSTMQDAMRDAGLISKDIDKRENVPKITLDISHKTKSSQGNKRPKKISKNKKSRRDPVGNPQKENVPARSKITIKAVSRIPDEKTSLENLVRLGFVKPENALNYWESIKEHIKGKTSKKSVTLLNALEIRTPNDKQWGIDTFNDYINSTKFFFKHFKENKSLDHLKSLQQSIAQTTINKTAEAQKTLSRADGDTQIRLTLEDIDTETLFKKYRDAILSRSKGNTQLSINAQITIDAINSEFLRRFKGKVSKDDIFIWPSTKIYSSRLSLSNKLEWQKEGILSLYGYRVGKTKGEELRVRRQILDEVFRANIPPVLDTTYIKEWGYPRSTLRLQKMANTLASLARQEKRRGKSFSAAYEDREEDLSYLHREYYVGKFGFGWPET